MARLMSIAAFVMTLAWSMGLPARQQPPSISQPSQAVAAPVVRVDLTRVRSTGSIEPIYADQEPVIRTRPPQSVDNPLAMLMALQRAF